MKRPLAVTFLALAAPLLLLGCGKDNPAGPKDDPQPFVYPDQSTPKNTLLRMAIALENRDSVMTDSVYADDYVGTSIDLTDWSPVTFTFSKSDEVRVVGALALSSSVTYVNVEFYSPESWSQINYGSDPPGWITVQIHYFRIEIRENFDGFQVTSPSPGGTRIFEFTLRPTPDASSPTDTTWTIVRWMESRAQN